MSRRFTAQDGTTVLLSKPVIGHVLCVGQTVPAAGSVGYAPNGIFVDEDATGGTGLYVNRGTFASAAFDQLTPSGSLSSITSATRTLTAADSGKTFALNLAAGIAVTLPTPAAGMFFKFVIQTTFTGAATIKSAASAHVMIGHALMGNDTDNSTVLFQALAASTFDTIDLFGTANSTGGIAGQVIEITGLDATTWFVEIVGDAAGTEATPFANTVA